MLEYLPQTSEWDEPGFDEDTKSSGAGKRSFVQRVKAARQYDSALMDAIEHAQTPEALILLTRVAISPVLADRLKEILQPEDIESDAGENAREPKLPGASIKSLLKFCLRAGSLMDERFVPGRTYAGELGLQFLDRRRGDLSVRFLGDGRALVAIAAESRQGSCQCAADDLLTDRDPFVVSRWLDPADG
jgi:hypothetical protein